MSAWILDESGVIDSGDIGGDGQLTDAPSVRLHLLGSPGSMITISFYGQVHDPNTGDPFDEPLEICEHVELVVCRDPADPGGTEVWADLRYTVIAAEVPREGLAERALVYAEYLALDPRCGSLVRWDGLPYWNPHTDPLCSERFALYERIAATLD